MAHRPRVTQEAASTNEVPTLGSTVSISRSASYPAPDHEVSHKIIIAEGGERQNKRYRQQLKTALIELLNEERVGSRSKARRSLQNVLMDIEQRLREQRRHSLQHRL
ncbi:hypothetical protein N7454_003259 [Penicillium verhagenii]|nr:hypothetical protein N7454_003259 [Penicillium verhagenii]